MPTYKQQFDKLTAAYINGEVDPMDCQACFVGNMLNNKNEWGLRLLTGLGSLHDFSPKYIHKPVAIECIEKEGEGMYTPDEIVQLENIFLKTIRENGGNLLAWKERYPGVRAVDEEALFLAFEKTLDALKQLHISKGEDVEGEFIFVKRNTKENETTQVRECVAAH